MIQLKVNEGHTLWMFETEVRREANIYVSLRYLNTKPEQLLANLFVLKKLKTFLRNFN